VPGNAAGNNLVFSDFNGGWSAIFEAPKNAPLDIKTGGVKFADSTTNSKKVELSAASVSSGQTRVLSAPDASGVIALTTDNADQFGSGSAPDNYVLTSDGAGGAAWEAASGGGGGDTVSIQSTAADILSVSSGAISADDAGADRIVYWNNTSNKLTYGTPADVGAAASSHTHSDATQSVAGFLSTADKTKIDGISSGANNYTHPNHTGDVTSAGDGATTIANNAVTNAKLAQVATGTLKGRATAGTGNAEDLTASQARTILNVADGATANSSDATLLARANHTGTQAATTITGLATVATTGAYGDLSGRPTLGTAAAAATTDFAAAAHNHAASAITSGTLDVARIPTGTTSTTVALGNHGHELTSLAATGATNGHVLTANGSGGVTFSAATGGSGVTAVGTTLADILSVSGSDLVADDLAADKLYGWDDSESKAIGFIIGSGLSVSGDTLSATASGGSKTYAVFTAGDNQPPSTAFATLDTRGTGIAVLDFDAATDESAVFVGVIPEGASLGSGLKVFLHWMASTATSGNCRWGVQFEKSGTDLDSDSFDTATEAHSAANGTSGIETVTEITATAIDSLAAGNRFRLKVFRNADDATNDTMTGDAELIAVEIRSAA
jgi:hypothetical protein